MEKKKITIVGAGNVGATTAQWGAKNEVGHIVLVDMIEGMPAGKALDLMQTGSVEDFDVNLIGTNDYKDTKDSDLIVITAGLARKPGMSRDDLQDANYKIVREVTEKIMEYSKNPIIMVVTNPLDVMCYVALKISGLKPEKVFGMAGILDTSRMRAFISMELGISKRDVFALVLGGHGDSMVPLPSYTTVGGINISKFLPKDKIDAIVNRTRKGGGEIVALLKTGSAYYAPAASVIQMADAILNDRKRVLPCSAWLTGQYGINETYVGVPIILGKGGVEKIIELDLTKEELAALQKSASEVKAQMSKLLI
jgi:malate dehydrogenase